MSPSTHHPTNRWRVPIGDNLSSARLNRSMQVIYRIIAGRATHTHTQSLINYATRVRAFRVPLPHPPAFRFLSGK